MGIVCTPVEQLNRYVTSEQPAERMVNLSLEYDQIHRDKATLASVKTSWIYLSVYEVLGITTE